MTWDVSCRAVFMFEFAQSHASRMMSLAVSPDRELPSHRLEQSARSALVGDRSVDENSPIRLRMVQTGALFANLPLTLALRFDFKALHFRAWRKPPVSFPSARNFREIHDG